MSLLFGAHFEHQSASASRPHIFAHLIARSAANDLLFDWWNASTSAGRVACVDLNGKFYSAALTAGDILYAVAGGVSSVKRLDSLAIGTAYQILRVNAGATAPEWGAVNLAAAAAVTGVLPNANTTGVSANTASALVARDGSGNFSAGTITATLTGNVTGNLTGNVTGNLTGTVLTAAQASITSLGTLTGLTMGGTLTLGAHILDLTSATISGTPTWSSSQAITLSTAAQGSVTSLGTLTALTVSGTVSHTNASPFSMTNGQVVTVALTAQTVGASTLTIPNFANVNDTFVFLTLAQELANKTLNASVGKGTWTASGTWTLPAVTLGGTISGTPTWASSQAITLSTAAQASVTSLGTLVAATAITAGGSSTGAKPALVLYQNSALNITSGTDASAASFSLPASTLSTNSQQVRITVVGRWNTDAGSYTVHIKFGATDVLNLVIATATFGISGNFSLSIVVARTGATAQLAVASGTLAGSVAAGIAYNSSSPAETLSGALTIDFRGNGPSGGPNSRLFYDAIMVEYFSS